MARRDVHEKVLAARAAGEIHARAIRQERSKSNCDCLCHTGKSQTHPEQPCLCKRVTRGLAP